MFPQVSHMKTIVTGLIVGVIGALLAAAPAISQPRLAESKFTAIYRAELKKRHLDADSADQVLVERGKTECGLIKDHGETQMRWYRESGALILGQPGIAPEDPEISWRGARRGEARAIYRDNPEILEIEVAKIDALFGALWQTDYCHSFVEYP
jgi:hypothetical protein